MDWSLIVIGVGSAATVLLAIFEFPRFLRWWRTRRQAMQPGLTRPATDPSHVHLNVWNAPAIQVNNAIENPPLRQESIARSPKSAALANVLEAKPIPREEATPASEVRQLQSAPSENSLFDGTITAEGNRHDERHFKLEKGAKVRCFAREVEGQDFNLYLMDQANYASFYKGNGSRDLFTGENEPIFKFQRTVPRTGTWYLVIHAPQKRYSREVRVEFSAIT